MGHSSKTQKYNDSSEVRIALLEQSISHIDQTLIRIESRINQLDEKIDKIESKIHIRIDKLDNRLWQIIFLISSSVVAIVLGKIFHWL